MNHGTDVTIDLAIDGLVGAIDQSTCLRQMRGSHAVSRVTEGSQVSSFAYDAAGHTTTRDVAGEAVQNLIWDAEGELSRVTQSGESDASFVYTADGDRLIRRQGGVTTVYLPGGQELTLTAGGATRATRYYSWAGQTVAVRTGTTFDEVSTLVSDHQGTASMSITNVSAQISRRYQTPFGESRGAVPSAWSGDHGFLDKPADQTGLTAVGARYYDPSLGRFVSVDPVMDLTDPQQWHGYAYGNNNPVTWSDPTGRLPIGAGHVGYNPRTQPKGGDSCARAQSCAKKVTLSNGRESWQRVYYTRYAKKFFTKDRPKYLDPRFDRSASAARAAGVSAGTATTGVGAANDGVSVAYAEKLRQKSKLKLNSGDPARRAADRATWNTLRNSPFVKGATRIGSNPFVKRAGVAGAVLGYGGSFAKYSHDNGGDLGLASLQAGADVGAALAGAAGGAKIGMFIGAFLDRLEPSSGQGWGRSSGE